MSSQSLQQSRRRPGANLLRYLDTAWRVLIVALVPALFSLLLRASGGTASLGWQEVVSGLAQGVLIVLVLLPLARRLPYRMPTRMVILFLPLYWTTYLGNLVEAYFYTTTSRSELVAGAIILIIPSLLIAWLIAWLFPADPPAETVVGIRRVLGERSLPSWIWRIAVVGLLYPIFLNYVFGALFSPIISRYYHNPAFMVQSHTISQPFFVFFPEETVRGVIFALTLLPALAVLRGRDWPHLLYTMLYLSAIGVVLEAIIGVAFSEPSWPVALRIAETFNTGLDGVSRGVVITLLLALPAAYIGKSRPVAAAPSEEPVADHADATAYRLN